VPEFRPRLSLAEGIAKVYEAMQRENSIPESKAGDWEDRLIAAQGKVAALAVG
jgi:hypothetical protein